MHKKSQGISITTIIIAAVALVVLIVLIAVFSNKFGLFGKEASKAEDTAKSNVCWSQPGYCVDERCASQSDIKRGGYWIDCQEGQACCVRG